MSAIIRQAAPVSPFPAARIPSFRAAIAAVKAAVVRAVQPSYAEKHARSVDIVSISRWNGYGRDSIGWSDIGYRI